MSDQKMSMRQHLEELRRRILIVAVGFVATFIVGFFFIKTSDRIFTKG